MTEDTTINLPASTYSTESGPLWYESEGQIANALAYLMCGLLCWFIVPLFYAFYRFLQTACHTYSLTNQRFRETSGILFRQTDELELYRVKDIRVQQPLLQRLVGCGRIVMMTSDRLTPVVVLNAIGNPLAVADLLRDCVERCRVAKGVREID